MTLIKHLNHAHAFVIDGSVYRTFEGDGVRIWPVYILRLQDGAEYWADTLSGAIFKAHCLKYRNR